MTLRKATFIKLQPSPKLRVRSNSIQAEERVQSSIFELTSEKEKRVEN